MKLRLTRQNTSIILACFIAVGGIVFVSVYPLQAEKNTSPKPLAALSANASSTQFVDAQIANQDSDHDGLKDWEETLWGTDPHNSDTDGDGTPDGEEVKEGRNPLIAGPNDKLSNSALSTSTPAGTAKTPQKNPTNTDSMAQDLFTQYMQLKQSGQTIDQTTQDNLVQNVLASHIQDISSAKVYTQSDIKITSDDSSATLKEYGNEIGAIIQKNSQASADSELIIVENAVNSQNQKDLLPLNPIIASYKNIVADLLKMQVPQTASIVHLELINGFSFAAQTDEDLSKTLSDPATGLVATEHYQTASQNLGDAFRDLTAYFAYKNIIFSPSESGASIIYTNGQ